MQAIILLMLLLWNTSVPVIGSNHIAFSGFTEGTVYTYYTNGANPITELTCIATPTDNTVSAISTSWYYKSSNGITDTGSNVLKFQDVATVVKWGATRVYFCKATYTINGQEQEENSSNIAVTVESKLFIRGVNTAEIVTEKIVIQFPSRFMGIALPNPAAAMHMVLTLYTYLSL